MLEELLRIARLVLDFEQRLQPAVGLLCSSESLSVSSL